MNRPEVDVVASGIRREYDAAYNTKVLKANSSFAEQVSEENTIYIIRWTFDLGGEEVEIPKNCILQFEGGSLENGSLSGEINIESDGKCLTDIYFSAAPLVPVRSDWFIDDRLKSTTEEFIDCTEALENFLNCGSRNLRVTKGYYYVPRTVSVKQNVNIIGETDANKVSNASFPTNWWGNDIVFFTDNNNIIFEFVPAFNRAGAIVKNLCFVNTVENPDDKELPLVKYTMNNGSRVWGLNMDCSFEGTFDSNNRPNYIGILFDFCENSADSYVGLSDFGGIFDKLKIGIKVIRTNSAGSGWFNVTNHTGSVVNCDQYIVVADEMSAVLFYLYNKVQFNTNLPDDGNVPWAYISGSGYLNINESDFDLTLASRVSNRYIVETKTQWDFPERFRPYVKSPFYKNRAIQWGYYPDNRANSLPYFVRDGILEVVDWKIKKADTEFADEETREILFNNIYSFDGERVFLFSPDLVNSQSISITYKATLANFKKLLNSQFYIIEPVSAYYGYRDKYITLTYYNANDEVISTESSEHHRHYEIQLFTCSRDKHIPANTSYVTIKLEVATLNIRGYNQLQNLNITMMPTFGLNSHRAIGCLTPKTAENMCLENRDDVSGQQVEVYKIHSNVHRSKITNSGNYQYLFTMTTAKNSETIPLCNGVDLDVFHANSAKRTFTFNFVCYSGSAIAYINDNSGFPTSVIIDFAVYVENLGARLSFDVYAKISSYKIFYNVRNVLMHNQSSNKGEVFIKNNVADKTDVSDALYNVSFRNVGTTANRPSYIRDYMKFFDTTLKKPVWKLGNKYISADGADADISIITSFAGKPAADKIYPGFRFFCTTKRAPEVSKAQAGIIMIYKGLDSNNNPIWVDALGRVVDDTYPDRYKGPFASRPSNLTASDEGHQYYDTDNSRVITWNGTMWKDQNGVSATARKAGTLSQKPVQATDNIYVGYTYYLTDSHKLIVFGGAVGGADKWYYTDGTLVEE